MHWQINSLNTALSAVLVSTTLTLSACGGGGGGGDVPASVNPPVTVPITNTPTTPTDNTPTTPVVVDKPAEIVGTAAIGAALQNGKITITDRTGVSVCSNDPITTTVSGAYSCQLTANALPPFAIVAIDPDGLVNPMISVVATKPGINQTATANVTPLTTAIAAQLDPNKDAFTLLKDPSLLANVDVPTLNAIKTNVVAQLAQVLVDAGINPTTFDPITTPFIGGSSTGVDKMLDQVRVTFDNGSPVLSNTLNPNAPSVPMAGSTTTSVAQVSTSAITTPFSVAELDFAKTQLEACFAVPAATRATVGATGEITSTSAACKGFLIDDAPSTVRGTATYLHTGYFANRSFTGLLTDPSMDGAKINLPELLRYVTQANGQDEAVINIKYRDKNGISGNRIIIVKKFTGSATAARNTNWWFYGNQRPLDAFIRSAIRQREQTIPSSVFASTTTFNNAAISRYESSLEIFVQRPNNNLGNPNSNVQYVRVKGPGLPTAGLVYGDVSPTLPQSWMGILNAAGTIPSNTTAQLAGVNGGESGNIFRIQRSQGITGTAAFTLRPNPSASAATAPFVSWAHPSMYGEAPSATWQFNLANVPAWSLYTFEAFCGLPATLCHTFTSRIVTPLMPATFAATQQWHTFASNSAAFVTSGAAATNNVDIAWTVNALAERVASVNAYSFGPGGQINSPSTGVPKGTVSVNVLASPAGSQFPAISTSSNATGRTLQLRYNMLDGSYKDQLLQFN